MLVEDKYGVAIPLGWELWEDDHGVYLYRGTEVIASFTAHASRELIERTVKAILTSNGAN